MYKSLIVDLKMELVNDIDPKVRFLVLHVDAGLCSKEISEILGRSYSTVQDWVRRTDEGEDIREVQPGRGRKPTYSPDTKRKVVRAIRENPQKYSTRSLGSKFGMSHSTAHNILLENGFTYGSDHLVQYLTPEEKQARVDFCLEMLEDDRTLFETFYSDEMGINLSDAHKSKTWAREHTAMEIEIPRINVHLNCWGAVSFRGATSLSVYKGTTNKDVYQGLLEEHRQELDALYPNGWYFVHDNHRSHKACEQWMENQGFGHVVFPTYSPDLNPIENLWATLKDCVARDAPTNEERLVASLRRNWEILTSPRNLRPYFITLIARYRECIEKEGIRLPL